MSIIWSYEADGYVIDCVLGIGFDLSFRITWSASLGLRARTRDDAPAFVWGTTAVLVDSFSLVSRRAVATLGVGFVHREWT